MAEVVKAVTKEPLVEKTPEIIEISKVPAWMGVLATLAFLLALITIAWVYLLQSHIAGTENKLAQANLQNSQLKDALDDTNLRMKAQGRALGDKVGLTQKELADKSAKLVEEDKRQIAEVAKAQQKRQAYTESQVAAVQTDVQGVKTDVSAMKTDVATTQAEQASIKKSVAKVASGQDELGEKIATNTRELTVLKHKGERTFYQFAIERGAAPINLGTIKLSTTKVDVKNNKFTLIISSDDKKIEKKDQTLNQAITFYSGKDPQLFEVVVNGISSKMIAGYLSVPNDAPKPMVP
jgi:chromosome segregation ATPase